MEDWFHDIRVSLDAVPNLVSKTNVIYFKELLNIQNFNAYVNFLKKPNATMVPQKATIAVSPKRKKKN